MTKFKTLFSPTVTTPTVFNKIVTGDTIDEVAGMNPTNYDNVLYLGYDAEYQDVFIAWDDECNDFTLFFGKKGTETYQTIESNESLFQKAKR